MKRGLSATSTETSKCSTASLVMSLYHYFKPLQTNLRWWYFVQLHVQSSKIHRISFRNCSKGDERGGRKWCSAYVLYCQLSQLNNARGARFCQGGINAPPHPPLNETLIHTLKFLQMRLSENCFTWITNIYWTKIKHITVLLITWLVPIQGLWM